MTVFDLIFLLAFLASVIALIAAAVVTMRGRSAKGRNIFVMWAVCAAIYFAASFAVSYAKSPQILHAGEPWCFDDWCLTVDEAKQSPAPPLVAYDVQFHISSRAGRITQRANGAWVYLIDELVHLSPPQPDALQVPLDAVLRPNESLAASRTFQIS